MRDERHLGGKHDEVFARDARRNEFDNAIREYGAECASVMKLAFLGDHAGEDYQEATAAKTRATLRVQAAWQAMVAAGDPETRR